MKTVPTPPWQRTARCKSATLGVRERHRQGGGDAGETVRVESAEGEFPVLGRVQPQEPDPAARLEL